MGLKISYEIDFDTADSITRQVLEDLYENLENLEFPEFHNDPKKDKRAVAKMKKHIAYTIAYLNFPSEYKGCKLEDL